MNEPNKPLPVEPLTYQGMPQRDSWKRVHQAIAWVGVLVGVSRMMDGVSALWNFGLLSASPYRNTISPNPPLAIVQVAYLVQTLSLGCLLLLGAWGILSGIFSGKRLVRISELGWLIFNSGVQIYISVFTLSRRSAQSSFPIFEILRLIVLLINSNAFSLMVITLFAVEDRSKRESIG
jgi:hypothetical protein